MFHVAYGYPPLLILLRKMRVLIVLPDNSEIRLKINGRDESYLLALDARNKVYSSEEDLILRKANFSFKLAKLKSDNFYSTLRNKLLWGLDQRN